MNSEIWQQLVSLESRDAVIKWFYKLHKKELSNRRAIEINSAARQAREYFRNANDADYTVKPLLTFYGVASLSRSFILLMKRDGGEETLKVGHGLNTENWAGILSGNISSGLQKIGELKVKTCCGLFYELIKESKNRICLHTNSSGIDWQLDYNIPKMKDEITFADVLSRIPDLKNDIHLIDERRYFRINDLTYTEDKGFSARLSNSEIGNKLDRYKENGYSIDVEQNSLRITCPSDKFKENLPLFIHSYVYKMFGSIPSLYIVEPFKNFSSYSQICMTYLVSYYLGMLVRYFPSYWVSLITGAIGDKAWPVINRAQHYVETIYPELVIEFIRNEIDKAEK